LKVRRAASATPHGSLKSRGSAFNAIVSTPRSFGSRRERDEPHVVVAAMTDDRRGLGCATA
jgi:hypothetical protein